MRVGVRKEIEDLQWTFEDQKKREKRETDHQLGECAKHGVEDLRRKLAETRILALVLGVLLILVMASSLFLYHTSRLPLLMVGMDGEGEFVCTFYFFEKQNTPFLTVRNHTKRKS